MKLRHYIISALAVALSAGFLTACDDDDDEASMAKAVLASTKSLTFDGTSAEAQIITVYSDAQWVAEVPDWVVISPETGTGTTEVVISVSDNLRDGALDNPRKADLVFKGTTLASRATVTIMQTGDNYRDCPTYTPDRLYDVADEAYVEMSDAIVATRLAEGCMVADSQFGNYFYVATAASVAVGDKITLRGQKLSDNQGIAYLKADDASLAIASRDNAIAHSAPTDITATLDSYTSQRRDYVAVQGMLVGTVVTVSDSQYDVSIVDQSTALDLAAVDGHIVTVTGYFAGVAAPYVRLCLDAVEDHGEARITYWTEDFEWLEPWAVDLGAGRTVETDDLSANAPQIVKAASDGTNALDEAIRRGYQFIRYNKTEPTTGECIYIQQNYLKMGKTGYHAAMILPAIDNIPEGTKNLQIEFDWCPMRQGSGKVDPLTLLVIVKNGDDETRFETTHDWENDHTLEWIRANFDFSGLTIDKNTEIMIRNNDEQMVAGTANRWFIDNIRIYSKL